MTRSRVLATVVSAATLTALTLTACSTGSTASTSSGSDTSSVTTAVVDADAFPVTIKHALGETTITEAPQRVATLGWSDQDHALTLGVTPVGATALTWGGNDAKSSD